MALSDGDNFVYGDRLSYQQANRMKNNFRGASAPSNVQPGMLHSDSDNDKLFHATGTSGMPLEEVLQATKSADVSPVFDDLYLTVHQAAVSDPPTEAELQAEFGATPAAGFKALLQNITSGSGKFYDIRSDGASYFYLEFTKAT